MIGDLHDFNCQELSYQSQLFICHKQPATKEVPSDSQAKELGIGPQWQLQAIGSDMVTSVEELRCLEITPSYPPSPPKKKKHVLAPKKTPFGGDQGSKVMFAVMKYISPFCFCFLWDGVVWNLIIHQAGWLVSSNVWW